MSFRYSIGKLLLPIAPGMGPLWELQAGPTDYPILMAVAFKTLFSSVTNSQLTLGIGRSTAIGSGVLAKYPLQAESIADGSGAFLAMDWQVPPTAPTNYLRRVTLLLTNNTLYAPVALKFPRGLKLSPSTSLSCWILSTGQLQNDCTELSDIEIDI